MTGNEIAKTLPGSGPSPGSFPALGAQINVLLVWPSFPPSFWGFDEMIELIPESTMMPPLGLITVAALCPPEWSLRLIDCSFEELRDEDLLWADLVMLSGMQVQREGLRRIAARARALGRRTILGGPYASSQPDQALEIADHVVVGEPEEVFSKIAADLESGAARNLYVVDDKPDVTATPMPRFDLLQLDRYASMSVQFSRGCPFECEFCDIITIYGRRPRTKSPAQMLAELDALYSLGWRNQVFVVDDNFVGNHKRAFELVQEIAPWQKARNYPFALFTEASMDLAQRPDLVDAMVAANFLFVFLGIESPDEASLRETKKYQNLRQDPLSAIRMLQERGLWVMGGFIVGFDSDGPDIFQRQQEFIERAAIPWAMVGFLQAAPTTPLYDRMASEGRLFVESEASSNFHSPNFQTVLPRPFLQKEFRELLLHLYEPAAFYKRAFDSLQRWNVSTSQHAPPQPLRNKLYVAVRSMWVQGVQSSYRKDYWRFLVRLFVTWRSEPVKIWLGFFLLCTGHHFVRYSRTVAAELDAELANELENTPAAPNVNRQNLVAGVQASR